MRAPVLVEFARGGVVESRHRGTVVVADAQGNDPHALGDAHLPVYVRSALKPFAAALVVAEGAADAFGFSVPEIAIIGGSHSGTDEDVAAVVSILDKAGVPRDALRNGTKEAPGDEQTKARLAVAGEDPGQLRQMCSGEHAGLLALAHHKGWDTAGYWEAGHPLQQAVNGLVARLFMDGEEPQLGIDDCALPTPLVPMWSIARAYAWLARPDRLPPGLSDLAEPLARVRDAMLAAPARIGGDGLLDTDLIVQGDGSFVAKEGAEGILGVGSVGCGLGVALQVEDGDKTRRASAVVAIAALEQLEMLGDDAAERLRDAHWPRQQDSLERAVGTVVATFNLRSGD